MARSSARLLQALKDVPLFSALADDAIAELLRDCPTVRRPAGTVLFTPAESAERFYVILAGTVKLYGLSPEGARQVFHLYGPGQPFAEAAVLTGGKYPAFAELVEDAELLQVGRAPLRDAIRRRPELAMGMLAGMSRKLREFNRLIADLSLRDVPSRIAAALLRCARAAGTDTFRLPQTKRDLAAQLGTTPETLSRTLRRFRDEGLLQTQGRQITLLDPPALQTLAHPDQHA